MWRSSAAAVAATLLAGGCASVPPGPPPPAAAQPAEAARTAWEGRFVVTWTVPETAAGAERPVREERASGRFALRDAAGRTELDVFTPFGQTVARATSAPGRATLATADGTLYEADSPDALTHRVLGWRIPVARLPAWLRGEFAAAGAPRGAQYVDGDWEVVVDEWLARAPLRLTLRWPLLELPEMPRRVSIRLLVDLPEQ
jgi:outer membrane lipoprotein LolB